MEELARFTDMKKYFGATHAVDGVTLEMYKGEVRGLFGENGSGKSTLLSLISGMNHPDEGKMELDGRTYAPSNQMQASKSGVAMTVQEINTLADLTVAENIFLGQEEDFSKKGFRNLNKMNRMAKELLEASGLFDIDPSEDVQHYSLEQRKMIELVKAAHFDPKLLMVDETSTALSHVGRDELYKLIRTTKEKGNSVIFISHDLREVLSICDRVTVMRDGKIIATVESSELDETKLKNLMVGRELSGHYYREDYDTVVSDEVVMKVRGLTCGTRCRGIDFDLHRGEILGIGGLSESGMHELGRTIYGVEEHATGNITVEGFTHKLGTINAAIAANVGYISKNRDSESLFQPASILDNISVPCIDRIQVHNYVSPKKMRSFADAAAKTLNVKMSSVDQPVSSLSGGNKQKVALTKWISRGTEIFVMDGPTRGIDVAVKAVIYDMLTELQKQGKSIIIISEELLELIGCCDRILILRDGTISKEFLRRLGLQEQDLVQAMI